MTDDKDKNRKHPDDETMYVDKKMKDFEEQLTEGGMHVAVGYDSRSNLIDSKSFEDQSQEFRLEPKSERDKKISDAQKITAEE